MPAAVLAGGGRSLDRALTLKVRRRLRSALVAAAVERSRRSARSSRDRGTRVGARPASRQWPRRCPLRRRPARTPHSHNEPGPRTRSPAPATRRRHRRTRRPRPRRPRARRTSPASGRCPTRSSPRRRSPAPRLLHPQDRYAMAGGCYTLTARRRAVLLQADRPRHATSSTTPTRRSSPPAASAADAPSADTVWRIAAHRPRRRYAFTTRPAALALDGDDRFRPTRTTGCAAYPESPDRRLRRPHAGVTPSRRCAATSTRTPTGWPSSSSAATRTAASRGTRTARRTPSSTAPTTPRPTATAASSSRCCPASRTTTRSAGRRSRTGRRPTR